MKNTLAKNQMTDDRGRVTEKGRKTMDDGRNELHNRKRMTKPLIYSFCVLLCLFAVMPIFGYSGGDGTPENPYQICDVNALLQLSSDVNNYDKCFIMTADIDLAGYDFNNAVIAPYYGSQFTGKFNGVGHKISNLTINGTNSDLGLFGFIGSDGEVNNLGLENVNIVSPGGPRSRSSYAGLAAGNEGRINNCYSTGTIIRRNTNSDVGGLVGGNSGYISYCHSGGFVISDIVSNDAGPENYGVGGLVGYSYSGAITTSYSTANVFNEVITFGEEGTGGLVGHYSGTGVYKCFATGNVRGFNNVGGLLGTVGNIEDCYSTGDVTGHYNVGGLVGNNGIIIKNSYSTGIVNGVDYVGGLSGGYSYDVNSYFLNTSGPNNGYGEPLTDEQMKHQANFAGWDFVNETANGTDDIWCIFENVDYPKLAWQGICYWECAKANFDQSSPVNFFDFAIFANAWLAENTNKSLDEDSDVDIYDLKIFCNCWLAEAIP